MSWFGVKTVEWVYCTLWLLGRKCFKIGTASWTWLMSDQTSYKSCCISIYHTYDSHLAQNNSLNLWLEKGKKLLILAKTFENQTWNFIYCSNHWVIIINTQQKVYNDNVGLRVASIHWSLYFWLKVLFIQPELNSGSNTRVSKARSASMAVS